jgi:gliding motility-associated-like protein
MTVQLNAMATNGCSSATHSRTINVAYVDVKTINDTTILPDVPFRIGASWVTNSTGTPTLTWSPAAGLDNPVGPGPTATLKDDITYTVTATTVEGCTDSDEATIKVFKGSAIYVPTGFTPNDDGRNDLLRPLCIGITKIYFFRIYNRWGQLVFSTGKLGEGWNGKLNGAPQSMGTYAWTLKAEDMAGKIYEMKGTSTIIR